MGTLTSPSQAANASMGGVSVVTPPAAEPIHNTTTPESAATMSNCRQAPTNHIATAAAPPHVRATGPMEGIAIDNDRIYHLSTIQKETRLSMRFLNQEIRTGRLRANQAGRETYVKGSWWRQWLEGAHAEATPTDASPEPAAACPPSAPSCEPTAACPPSAFGTASRTEYTHSAV